MIVGLGIDLVDVPRIAALRARHGERFLERCFTSGEVARAHDDEHLAGLIAAKEAAFKALGTGWSEGVGWHAVRVERAESGAPSLHLTGAASERALALGVTRIHLSITHAAALAVAVVIFEA